MHFVCSRAPGRLAVPTRFPLTSHPQTAEDMGEGGSGMWLQIALGFAAALAALKEAVGEARAAIEAILHRS